MAVARKAVAKKAVDEPQATSWLANEAKTNPPAVSQDPPVDTIIIMPDDVLRQRMLEDLVLELVGSECTLRSLAKGVDTTSRSPSALSEMGKATLRDVLGRHR